jgi:hypothetical protein
MATTNLKSNSTSDPMNRNPHTSKGLAEQRHAYFKIKVYILPLFCCSECINFQLKLFGGN